MEKIYLLLMDSHTVPSKIIKAFTGYPYSHVGIALEPHCNVMYSFGRRRVHSIFNSGFTAERKNGEFFTAFHRTMCRIYEIEVSDEQYAQLKETLTAMLTDKEAYRYDMIGIVPRFFGVPFTRKNRYVCSYFVVELLEKAGVHRFDKPVCLIQPSDFEALKDCKEIYSGYYRLYP